MANAGTDERETQTALALRNANPYGNNANPYGNDACRDGHSVIRGNATISQCGNRGDESATVAAGTRTCARALHS